MKFVMIAELLLILFSNGIRFYSVKRYMDFLLPEKNVYGNITGFYILLHVLGLILSVLYLNRQI